MIDPFSHGMANIILLWWYFKDVEKYCKSISSLQDRLRFSTIAIEGEFHFDFYYVFIINFLSHGALLLIRGTAFNLQTLCDYASLYSPFV